MLTRDESVDKISGTPYIRNDSNAQLKPSLGKRRHIASDLTQIYQPSFEIPDLANASNKGPMQLTFETLSKKTTHK